MIEKDKKTQREAEFMRLHTLTEAEFKKLIDEKFARAKAYSEAWRKREALLVESR
jgi:hypothetical protein